MARGVKEVTKNLRQGKTGIIVLAGDVNPVEIICHIPIICEDKKIPYVYVNSRNRLGLATLSRNPTTVLMILKPSENTEFYEEYN